ncbi:MAG TPA: NAD(+) synthase [Steroidobacteraceae bacterium]
MNRAADFASAYTHGFCRVAVATPRVELGVPAANLRHTLELARRASERKAVMALFPELGLSGYSNEDLFQQDALLDAVETAIHELLAASRAWPLVLVVGAPLRAEGKLFNCALMICRGRLLGVIPKSYLPNYREFYEKRQFTASAQALSDSITVAGQRAPFGAGLVFEARDWPEFALHVEICEDVWVPLPPSTHAALAGATVLANLSASDVTIGKCDYRRLLCTSQSAKCIAAYLYAGAGYGESTTDLAWDGHALVCENGEVLTESRRFSYQDELVVADVDLERLRQERMRTTSFGDCVQLHRDALARWRHVSFDLERPGGAAPLERNVARFPYVPADPRTLEERCREAYSIQVQGLVRRMEATGIHKLVIGVSGGLDSTQALIVCAKAVDQLHLPRSNVLGYTLPGFATSRRTHHDALELMRALGVSAQEIDIRPAASRLLEDIGHPGARGEPRYDVTYENVQAGERASHLFRLANLHGGLVVGTSDLSELALGYTTYGVGDQMSHYAVNASVPKTLVQHLIRWAAHSGAVEEPLARVLTHILATRISPELIPHAPGTPPQSAESTLGPYELQDFNLYYLSRFGFRPSKVAFLASHAWSSIERGAWPESITLAQRRAYDLTEIKRWLEIFLRRFFETSQFKRSALPNAPKIGSGGSLSPRGDWRAPSDAHADVWLEELHANVP